MRIRAAIVIVLVLVSSAAPSAGQMARVEDPGRQGVGTVVFAPGTMIADFPWVAISYEGEWRDGLAHGTGLLRFSHGGGDVSPYISLPSTHYLGQFVEGRPTGGDLVHSEGPYVIKHAGAFGPGQIVVSSNGQELVVATPMDSANQKVIVRMMQYPNGQSHFASRMFFGEVTNGELSGEWVDLPWYEVDEGGVRAGYGRFTEGSQPDGWSHSCTHDARPVDPPTLNNALFGGQGPLPQALAGLDPIYWTNGNCVATSPEGWTFNAIIDRSTLIPRLRPVSCATADGRVGTLTANMCTYHERRRRHDIFTNIGREFKRFVDRRVLGTIDRGGASMERAMCRATGTEPGKNCNVSISTGATWPVGEGSGSSGSGGGDGARDRLLAASNRAAQVPASFDDQALGEAAGVAAELNAVCMAFCQSAGQRTYSAHLLAELERVAAQPENEVTIRSIASINRETASVLGAGLRILAAGVSIGGSAVAFYRISESSRQQAKVLWTAGEAVRTMPIGPNVLARLQQQTHALAVLHALNSAHLNRMASESANLLGQTLTSSIGLLRGLPPQRVRALTIAITLGKTATQVNDFVNRYKDVQSEAELYDAIIRETLTPLGITWPPPN